MASIPMRSLSGGDVGVVELDGATTGFLHAVDAGGEEHMHSGMRVMPRWRPERTGEIHDLVCFEPEDTP